ncbi:MAG: prolipoprotein diacylglyceryl transferase [Planctomycetes bacterium]|nr:prolipoprotein diacylglyceryl transferase [Planctomycetota bacterium]
MMPEIFRIPILHWPIQGYGLMIVIGFLLCTWLASREARRRGLQVDVYNFGVVMLLTGLLGGRIFHYIQFYEIEYADAPWYAFFAIWKGGLVFFGGAVGGILGTIFYIKSKKIDGAELFDAISPFIPVGMGFGRLGCLMNGCCWGGVCSEGFPLALIFPRDHGGALTPAFRSQLERGLISDKAAQALPVYPTQPLEAAVDFFLCGLLWWYLRGPSPRGGGLPLLFILYSISRFGLEFLRGDNAPFFLGLTISQVVAVVLLVACTGIFIFLWTKKLRIPILAGLS